MAGYMTSDGMVIRQGDSFDILMHLRDSRNGNINLDGCKLQMAVKSADGAKTMFVAEGEIIDAQNGKAVISLGPKQTDIAVGDYICDIQLTLSDNVVHTIYPQNVGKVGVFKITEQVTR